MPKKEQTLRRLAFGLSLCIHLFFFLPSVLRRFSLPLVMFRTRNILAILDWQTIKYFPCPFKSTPELKKVDMYVMIIIIESKYKNSDALLLQRCRQLTESKTSHKCSSFHSNANICVLREHNALNYLHWCHTNFRILLKLTIHACPILLIHTVFKNVIAVTAELRLVRVEPTTPVTKQGSHHYQWVPATNSKCG